MAAVQHVGVIGAGLAGLTAAVAAAQAGARVDLFEALPEPVCPPAHIDVVPNLLRDLAALGLAEACVRRGFPHQGLSLLDGDGSTRFDVPAARLAGLRWPPALGLVYGDLLTVLREAALALGVRTHRGDAVQDACDGGAIVTTRGHRHPVDLAVLACGDKLPAVGGTAPRPLAAQALPQQWCHALLPRPLALQRAAWVIGSHSLQALLVPVDPRRAGVAVLRPIDTPATPAALREALRGQGRLLQALGAHWTDDIPTLQRPVRSGVLAGAWHDQGVLRIGHSAHQLPPHFGQAAAQAVEDATVLGDLLRQRLPRDALLAAFMARRGERARRIHEITTQAARWQLQPEATTNLPALADRLAPLVAQPA